MGDKCCRSVTTKVRIEERAQPFGDWLVPLLNVLGESFRAEVGASNLTLLFVVFIALDAVSEVILNLSQAIFNLRSKLQLNLNELVLLFKINSL